MSAFASRPRYRVAAIVALLLVPLAVVGFFAGALAGVGSGDARVPAAIVNSDEMVQQTAADGSTTPVLAGRLLVTELTGDDWSDAAANAFDWTITGEDEAEAALKNGDVYAVLTIPEDFSKSIVSLQSDDPTRAQLTIETDDAHGYLTGPLTDTVGDGLAALFGNSISEQFIAGLVGGTAQLGGALTSAADGAGQLASGATGLATGLGSLRDGTASAASGAHQYVDGVETYTDGVSSLSSGLGQLDRGAAGLSQLPAGVQQYTSAVQTSADALAGAVAAVDANPLDPVAREQLRQISAGLSQLASGGPALVAGIQGGVSQIQGGISQSANGASQLAAGGSSLVSGGEGLAAGLDQLATGAGASADGAAQLATGAGELATGLSSGAGQIPSYGDEQAEKLAEVAASPIGLETVRSNEVEGVLQIVSTLLVPVGLWIGALAVFLALGAATRRLFASTASNLRVTGYLFSRAGAIVGGQALLLVILLHTALGVAWSALPATLVLALLTAVVVTALHAFLTVAFGRWGMIVSLVLLALQLTATGGLYPVELLSAPFRVLSPLLPITEAQTGMQAIVAGAGTGAVVAPLVQLLVWAVLAGGATVLAVSRKRTARATGLLPATA